MRNLLEQLATMSIIENHQEAIRYGEARKERMDHGMERLTIMLHIWDLEESMRNHEAALEAMSNN